MLRSRTFLAILALCALPVTCINVALRPHDTDAPLEIRPLADPPPGKREIASGLTWLAGWELTSENTHFDGYSALVARADGSLLAGSDRGRLLEFRPAPSHAGQARFSGLTQRHRAGKRFADLEALYEDPTSGTLWAAFERRNAVLRFDSGEQLTGWSKPEAILGWANNGGPEAMTRLADGRFLIIAESPRSLLGETHEAVVFDGDPVDGAEATSFLIDMPDGFRPVDVAQLPDGTLAMLLRKARLGVPPGFESAIIFGSLDFGRQLPRWRGGKPVVLASPVPSDNYEGLAVRQSEDGSAELWIISDNNRSMFQRTYLIKLRWSPNEKTRRHPARSLSENVAATRSAK